jgi:hypothetical protein
MQPETLKKVIKIIEKEIEKIKSKNYEGENSVRQITNGGKLLALNKLKSKLKSMLLHE